METPNPDYGDWNWNKYIRSNEIYNTVGLTCRTKFNLIVSKNIGFEFAFFSNINDFKSIYGIELWFLFGRTMGMK